MKQGSSPPRSAVGTRIRASALVVVLLFLVLLTGVTVLLLLRGGQAMRTASSQAAGTAAVHLAHVAFGRVVAELQAELEDARAQDIDLLLPVRYGAVSPNPRVSKLVRRSLGDDSAIEQAFQAAGFSEAPVANVTSGVASDAQPTTGPVLRKTRWNEIRLLSADPAFDGFTAPDWIYIGEDGPGKNPTTVVGRFAYMLYDVGGMFDINVAGFGVNGKDLAGKGLTVFADLDPMFDARGGSFEEHIQWRHGGTNPDINDYYGAPGQPGPDGAGLLERQKTIPPGQNRLFSRQELIAAGDSGEAGISPELAAELRTISSVANRISAEDLFADGTQTQVGIEDVRLQAERDVTLDIRGLDGSTVELFIQEGQPLFSLRFPLARLRWLAEREADGTPKHPDMIKRYFGLTWDTDDRIFIYTSPDSGTAATSIKTLVELAKQINDGGAMREPDFFEWLKAAINPNSLGQTGGSTNRIFPSGTGRPEDKGRGPDVPWEVSKDLHILRIGANIVDQADPDSVATGIRSSFAGVDPDPFDSFGQENLPGINEVITSVLRDGSQLDGYLQFELWNPNRNAASGGNPPRDFEGNNLSNFRIRILGGRALMEPMVYVTAMGNNNLEIRADSPASPTELSGKENDNNPWSSMKRIVEHSQRNLTPAAFTSAPLADKAIAFSMGAGGGFFDEPYLVNGAQAATNSMDKTGVTTMAMLGPIDFEVALGAPPTPGQNSILLASVDAPNPNFSGLKPSDIYEAGSLENSGLAHNEPSGDKAWNAVQFYTQGTLYNVDAEPITFVIETEVGGRWWPYQIFHNLDLGTRAVGSNSPQCVNRIGPLGELPPTKGRWTNSDGPNDDFSRWDTWQSRRSYPNVDPRTERFALTDQVYASPGKSIRSHTEAWQGKGAHNWNLPHGMNTKPGTSFTGTNSSNEPPRANPEWTWTAPGPPNIAVLADLAMNTGAVPDSYSYEDVSGVRRRGDAGWLSLDQHPALPLASYPGAKDARPIFLDRPFRSVGELGAVFRDIPWRSLDLFSAESPDRRLLDVFSIEDGTLAQGKINPNSAGQETLRALVREAALDPSDPNSSRVGEAVAHGVADMLSSLDPSTPAGRIPSLENLARRLAEAPQAAPTENNDILSYKTKAENFLRSLAPAVDTRTWQLMADVVVQAGRLPPGKTDPADFIVQGQRRYWVYLAIDRLTGEITHQRMEPIYE